MQANLPFDFWLDDAHVTLFTYIRAMTNPKSVGWRNEINDVPTSLAKGNDHRSKENIE